MKEFSLQYIQVQYAQYLRFTYNVVNDNGISCYFVFRRSIEIVAYVLFRNLEGRVKP